VVVSLSKVDHENPLEVMGELTLKKSVFDTTLPT